MRILPAIFLLLPVLAVADASLPANDRQGSADLPYLKRYEGAVIIDQVQKSFDEFSLPISRLEEAGKKGDNDLFLPTRKLDVEGKVTRSVYLVPEGRSPLEVIRNYQEEVSGKGGSLLFECKGEECGGSPTNSANVFVNRTGLLYLVYPYELMVQPKFSTGDCAIRHPHSDQRYIAMKMATPEGNEVHLALLSYIMQADIGSCNALNGRTVLVLAAVEGKAREQRMATIVPADDMGKGIGEEGHVALYGIHFDYDKADLKPDSKPQLEEIAKLLKTDTALNVLVVGHTDNQGELDYNLNLSRHRAEAVVRALVSDYGIDATRLSAQGVGMAAPVASNQTPDGQAMNRRVEVVSR
ncbi:MAG: DUF4892 domain-containing protein [Candidatus Thiothrix putei]|uniref:DUF4892 domain-containing protein n=1 Tax=Candidatus Thiothrix putei TaxID=3080811 RepID=A0AA95KPL3_9GAMM|nr:MAG: DUF4892 domain-containing protein [Candidatus Thiothrix putei]